MRAPLVNTIRKVRINGAGRTLNEPSYWVHEETVDVNNDVDVLFPSVFAQYNYVYIWDVQAIEVYGVPKYKLREGTNLLAIMMSLNMNLCEGDIEIWAENK